MTERGPAHPHVAVVDGPLGRLVLVASERGLVAVERAGPDDDVVPTPSPPPWLDDACTQVSAYLRGEVDSIAAPVDLSYVPRFDAAVYRAVRRIPYGCVASYGDVARAVGVPRAARAVGTALARCPLGIVVPCHRVVRSDGSVAGSPADVRTREHLLDLEARHAPARGRRLS